MQEHQQQSEADVSLVFQMLKREDKLREEAKIEKEKLRQDMETKTDLLRQEMAKLRKEMKPVQPKEAILQGQLVALQTRLESLHATQLLTDEELHTLEDMVADYLELKASMGIVSLV